MEDGANVWVLGRFTGGRAPGVIVRVPPKDLLPWELKRSGGARFRVLYSRNGVSVYGSFLRKDLEIRGPKKGGPRITFSTITKGGE